MLLPCSRVFLPSPAERIDEDETEFAVMLARPRDAALTHAIVNVSSIDGLKAKNGLVAYASSKWAIRGLTKVAAIEFGRHNIRVNALGTGWTTAEEIPLEKQREELLVRYTPLRRKGHPRDIGPLLVYLCSEACDYTTGQAVYVDGGLNAHP